MNTDDYSYFPQTRDREKRSTLIKELPKETENIQWADAKNNPPKEHGYYYSFYFNEENAQYFYKAIWWNGSNWLNWRPYGDRHINTVEKYVPGSRNVFYVPCVEFITSKHIMK
jgi:hypothetical protein